MRSHFASFVFACVWLCAAAISVVAQGADFAFDRLAGLLDEALHIDFADHRASLDRQVAARDIDAVPIGSRFMAFVSRALTHDLFSGGRFLAEGRSTAA